MESKNSKKRLEETDAEMEMTPMIDVTFLLLIFFMCTLQFKTLEGKLAAYLPPEVGNSPTQPQPLEKIDIRIDVLEEGTRLAPSRKQAWNGASGSRYVFGDDRSVRYSVGPFQTADLRALRERLAELCRSAPRSPDGSAPKATIDPRGAAHQEVVLVLDAALEAGFEEVTFYGAE